MHLSLLSRTVSLGHFLPVLVFAVCLPGIGAPDKTKDKPKEKPAGPASNYCNRARFQAYPGTEKDVVGGVVAGSNVSRSEGFQVLGEIKVAPEAKKWGELRFDNKQPYRWLKVTAPRGGKGRIIKAEFYKDDKLLAGEGKGAISRPFLPNTLRRPDYSDDAKPDSDFESEKPDNQSICFEQLEAAAPRPWLTPETTFDGAADITIKPPAGTTVRYTLDGSWPTLTNGEIYSAPLHVEKNTTISAVAFMEGVAPSLPAANTFLLRSSARPGMITAHLGNSLTGTTSQFFRYARTAGYEQKTEAFIRGGALTRELWALASGEYASDPKAALKETVALKKGSTPWAEFWGKVGKVDLITMQPRDFDLDKEVAAEINFIKLFRQKSPDLQPWLYSEWVEMNRQRPSDKGRVPSYQMKKTFPALTWEESMGAMLLYVEELQHRLTAQYTEGKRPRILPAGLAMGWIKNQIEHGRFPGAKPGTFYTLLFNDQVHPAAGAAHGSANGGYLVDMTWFSAFYRQPPEGHVLALETTFTPEQKRAVDRLAWDVIENYPDCGLYKEGRQPCGAPKFASDGRSITLSSSTPGAWFRYTLDGTTPTRTCGYVYCGVISVQPGIQVKAVAYKSGMADSEMAEMK